jgi:hypothetical protein
MKLNELSPKVRNTLADRMKMNRDALRHIASGHRGASAEMAIKIERAALRMGIPIQRESLCAACGGCELAKKARKS